MLIHVILNKISKLNITQRITMYNGKEKKVASEEIQF